MFDPAMVQGERLILRQWQPSDKPGLCALNADPEVMRFFPALLSEAESLAMFDQFHARITERGWGLWAVEIGSEFAGITGIREPNFEAHFSPCVEIGWRFHKKFWGKGLAFEAANLAIRHGFEVLKLPQIVSFTAVVNLPSQNLMRRLGMTSNPVENFAHPKLPPGHWLSEHALYRLNRA